MAEQAKRCKIKDCKRPYRAKGYCVTHYKLWRHGEFGHTRFKPCSEEGCRKPMVRWGVCADHYAARRKKDAAAAAA